MPFLLRPAKKKQLGGGIEEKKLLCRNFFRFPLVYIYIFKRAIAIGFFLLIILQRAAGDTRSAL